VIDNPFYSQENHGPFERFALGDLPLEGGGCLYGAELAFATHGTLNAARDNAILVPTWYSGTSKVMEQLYIGEGRALDPARYFIIVANQLGNGLSSSPHNTAAPWDMGAFPDLAIADDVRAQHKLVTERFGIERLALVAGCSMGAQQTYEWAVRYPDLVARAAPIAGTARCTDFDKAFGHMLAETLESDPGLAHGWYTSSGAAQAGLRRHARLWALMGLCSEFYAQQVWRSLGFASAEDFVRGFLEAYFLPLDPNALLCMNRKWHTADVGRNTGGDLAAALGRITAKTFVMPIDRDMFFPPADCAREQALVPGSELRTLESICGHLGVFCLDPDYLPQVDRHLGELLELPA